MKITVQVDLSDFYCDDDQATFTEQIKNHIAISVKHQVLQDFKEQIGAEFASRVKEEIKLAKEELISNTLSELISESKIKKYGDSFVTIKEYLEEEIKRIALSDREIRNYLDLQVKTVKESVSKELKERYDLMFASQLISKMNDNGMLKDDIAKLLLS